MPILLLPNAIFTAHLVTSMAIANGFMLSLIWLALTNPVDAPQAQA
jgi:hypothetical protein